MEWAIIACAFVVAYYIGPAAWFPAAWVIGARMHALAEIGHMAMHRQILRSKADDWLARVAVAPVGLDLRRWREFHLAHHRNVGTDMDPEVQVVRKFSDRWQAWRLRDSIRDAFGLSADEMIEVMRRLSSPMALLIYVAIVAATYFLIGPLALLWIAASMTGFPLAHRLRAWTEHDHLNAPGQTFRKTRPTSWRRAWYLPHKVWMHYEHHNWTR